MVSLRTSSASCSARPAGRRTRAALVILTALLVGCAHPDVHAAAPLSRPSSLPELWIGIDKNPAASDLAFVASHYRVAILNAWNTDALAQLKSLNPRLTVLVYKDLMSTRSYPGAYDAKAGTDAARLPTGLGYGYANREHPGWFATDRSGRRVEWQRYPGHWQMAVWKPGYQRAWANHVAHEVVGTQWDGVFADNDVTTLSYLAPGVTLSGGHNSDLQAGNVSTIKQLANAFVGTGKLVVPNVTDGRLHPGFWNQSAVGGGAFDEQFLHFGNSPSSGYVGDWPNAGWKAQESEVAHRGLMMVHTNSTAATTTMYGYASFLIAGGGRGAFSATPQGSYYTTALEPEQTWKPGKPTHAAVAVGAGWVRPFTRIYVAVDPSDTKSVTVHLPIGLVDSSGKPVGSSVKLRPHQGAVYRRLVTITQ